MQMKLLVTCHGNAQSRVQSCIVVTQQYSQINRKIQDGEFTEPALAPAQGGSIATFTTKEIGDGAVTVTLYTQQIIPQQCDAGMVSNSPMACRSKKFKVRSFRQTLT